MSRFGKWLGKFNVTIDEEDFELKPVLGDKERLMALQQRTAKKKNLTTEEMTELQREQNKVFKEILRRSYSEEDMSDEEIEGFLIHNDLAFMQELYIAWGWLKREDLESIRGDLTKKVAESLD